MTRIILSLFALLVFTGCAQQQTAVNPVEWYRSTPELFAETKSSEELLAEQQAIDKLLASTVPSILGNAEDTRSKVHQLYMLAKYAKTTEEQITISRATGNYYLDDNQDLKSLAANREITQLWKDVYASLDPVLHNKMIEAYGYIHMMRNKLLHNQVISIAHSNTGYDDIAIWGTHHHYTQLVDAKQYSQAETFWTVFGHHLETAQGFDQITKPQLDGVITFHLIGDKKFADAKSLAKAFSYDKTWLKKQATQVAANLFELELWGKSRGKDVDAAGVSEEISAIVKTFAVNGVEARDTGYAQAYSRFSPGDLKQVIGEVSQDVAIQGFKKNMLNIYQSQNTVQTAAAKLRMKGVSNTDARIQESATVGLVKLLNHAKGLAMSSRSLKDIAIASSRLGKGNQFMHLRFEEDSIQAVKTMLLLFPKTETEIANVVIPEKQAEMLELLTAIKTRLRMS